MAYKKNREKARTPYQAYLDWYEQYAKRNKMQSEELKPVPFQREYESKKRAAKMEGRGTSNLARQVAQDQTALSQKQKLALFEANRPEGRVSFKQKQEALKEIGLKGERIYTDLREELYELDPTLRPPKPYKDMTLEERMADQPRRDRLREAFSDRLYHK